MVLENAPTECPSMNHETIVEYIKFRASKAGVPVTNLNGENVKDESRENILAIGGWNAPGNVKQFASAISAIHNARKQSGQYQDECRDCVAVFGETEKGCQRHYSVPRIERIGTF